MQNKQRHWRQFFVSFYLPPFPTAKSRFLLENICHCSVLILKSTLTFTFLILYLETQTSSLNFAHQELWGLMIVICGTFLVTPCTTVVFFSPGTLCQGFLFQILQGLLAHTCLHCLPQQNRLPFGLRALPSKTLLEQLLFSSQCWHVHSCKGRIINKHVECKGEASYR